jgi:hypothetical protein
VLIFNTSFYIDHADVEAWGRWTAERLLPEVEKAVGAVKVELFEVVSAESEESRVFSVQWRCDEEQLARVDDVLAELLKECITVIGVSATHFSSIMRRI